MQEFLSNNFPNVLRTQAELFKSIFQTLEMMLISGAISAAFGIIFGVMLTVCKPNGIKPQPVVYQILDKLINVFRSIPFVILISLLMPLTRLITGTAIGTKGAIFPLIVGTIPFFSRQVNAALEEVDPGMIEAAQSMGCSTVQIIWRVYLREGLAGIVRGSTITIVNIIGLTAMAGTVGGGGLGDYALRYGFQRRMYDCTLVTVVILLLLVTIIQTLGNSVTRRLKDR
ncbi:MAG: methionine ABC transporter permease [Eubacteriales bacterium]|nr:methionine ABC transporter permease [Eubacteriales bacterium]